MRQAYKGSTGRKRHEPYVDKLPEAFIYRDDGCEVAPACLRCPLPQCKYDDPLAYQKSVKEARNRLIVAAAPKSWADVQAVAESFGITQRTVWRVLSKARTVDNDA